MEFRKGNKDHYKVKAKDMDSEQNQDPKQNIEEQRKKEIRELLPGRIPQSHGLHAEIFVCMLL